MEVREIWPRSQNAQGEIDYAADAERLGLEPLSLAIHDLEAEQGHRHVFRKDNRERDTFATRLDERVEGIGRGDFQLVGDRSTCRSCDFAASAVYAGGFMKGASVGRGEKSVTTVSSKILRSCVSAAVKPLVYGG